MANYVILPDDAQFVCPSCGCPYDEREAARFCCASAYEGYQCDGCGESFSEKDEAAQCCPQVSETYLCSECMLSYVEEYEARECCAPDEGDIEGGKYKCVVDGIAWATPEEAMECCSYAMYGGEAVESMEDHGELCKCYQCRSKRQAATEAAIGAATNSVITATTTAPTFEIVFEPTPVVELTPTQAALATLPVEPLTGKSAFT